MWIVFLRQELDQLQARIQTLEDRSKLPQAEPSSLSATSSEVNEDTQAASGLQEGEEKDTGGKEEKEEEGVEEVGTDTEKTKREKAALVIQTNWKEHRNRVCYTTQQCMRGY